MLRRFSLLLALVGLLVAGACTQQQRARQFGGETTVQLPEGKKLINATWKESDSLWYLLRDMKEGEKPETIEFIESSSFGVWQGKVTFVEHAKGN